VTVRAQPAGKRKSGKNKQDAMDTQETDFTPVPEEGEEEVETPAMTGADATEAAISYAFAADEAPSMVTDEDSAQAIETPTASSVEPPVDAPVDTPPTDLAATDGRLWYVIHTYSGYENKVKKNLEHRIVTLDMGERIFRVDVPTVEEIEIRAGQRHPVQRKIFPGYVLVEMVMDDESWYVVRNTPGVTGFVGMGNKPTPLPEEEASGILKQMTTAAPTKFKVTLQPGQEVKPKVTAMVAETH